MRKKRVAVLGVKYFPSRGGVSRIAEDLLEELRDRYEWTIYCYKDARAAGHIEGVHVVQLPRLPLGSFGVFLYYALCCAHLMLRGRHDLVHVHKTDAAFFLPLLRMKFRCVATSHEASYVRDKWSAAAKLYFRAMERLFIRSKATLTCISRPLTSYYETRYERLIHFLPNGVRSDALELDRATARAASSCSQRAASWRPRAATRFSRP